MLTLFGHSHMRAHVRGDVAYQTTHIQIHTHTHTHPGKSKQDAQAKTPGKSSSTGKPTEASSSKKTDSAKKPEGGKQAPDSSSKKLVEVKAVPMDVWKDELVKVLCRLTRHEKAWPFLEPVDPVEVGDFHTRVYECYICIYTHMYRLYMQIFMQTKEVRHGHTRACTYTVT
jgi:hypothetical protein